MRYHAHATYRAMYSPFALCIVVYRRILKEVHLIKRWAGATAADVVSIVFYGGCNWESWIEKPEQSPRLLLVRGGGNFYGSDFLVSTHWAFRYEIYAKRPTTLFGIWHATRWHRYGGAWRHFIFTCPAPLVVVNLLWRRKGEFTSEFVRWFLFLFFYWPHSHLCECATDFPHLIGNTFGTRHVTRPALFSLTIQVHALNKYSISNALSFLKREEQHCRRFLLAKRKR